jgi:hypothetical protein
MADMANAVSRPKKKTMVMKFEDVLSLTKFMTSMQNSLLSNARCSVNWIHRHGCATLVDPTQRGGADQTCQCRPYALLQIRLGDGGV